MRVSPSPVRLDARCSNRTIAGLFAVLAVTLALLVVGISSGSIPVFVSALGFIGLCALIFGGRAVVHALRSSDVADQAGLADGLIIVGTFPALAMFWMIVPPILALVVIGGVLGTSPKLRAVRPATVRTRLRESIGVEAAAGELGFHLGGLAHVLLVQLVGGASPRRRP